MHYESPRRWLLGPASTDADGLGHSPAWLIGPSGATLGRRPDYSITSSARRAASGQAVTPPATSLMNSRRCMLDMGISLPCRVAPALYRTLNLPQNGRRVLGPDLNCPESSGGAGDPSAAP